MHARRFTLIASAPFLLAACAGTLGPEQQARHTETARTAANQLAQTLGGELKAAMQAGGPVNAIPVCKERAPAIAAAVGRDKGVQIRRVSFKQRNIASVPDAWEARVLRDFEQRLAGGATTASLEHSEVVREGNGTTFRYMKGLVIQEVCMSCHGTRESIPDAVKAKLAVEYPGDQATGYLPNMLRGAITVKKPL